MSSSTRSAGGSGGAGAKKEKKEDEKKGAAGDGAKKKIAEEEAKKKQLAQLSGRKPSSPPNITIAFLCGQPGALLHIPLEVQTVGGAAVNREGGLLKNESLLRQRVNDFPR